jgi:hypothetical protein
MQDISTIATRRRRNSVRKTEGRVHNGVEIGEIPFHSFSAPAFICSPRAVIR